MTYRQANKPGQHTNGSLNSPSTMLTIIPVATEAGKGVGTGATSICHVTMARKNLPTTLPFHELTAKIATKSTAPDHMVGCHILFMGAIPLHKFAGSTLGHRGWPHFWPSNRPITEIRCVRVGKFACLQLKFNL